MISGSMLLLSFLPRGLGETVGSCGVCAIPATDVSTNGAALPAGELAAAGFDLRVFSWKSKPPGGEALGVGSFCVGAEVATLPGAPHGLAGASSSTSASSACSLGEVGGGAAGRAGKARAIGAGQGREPLLAVAGGAVAGGGGALGAFFGGARVVIVGTTVVVLETGSLLAVLGPAGGAGTSTMTEHFGQRAFLPAYFTSTLNLVAQAGQRHRTSDMVESLWKQARQESETGEVRAGKQLPGSPLSARSAAAASFRRGE